MYEKNHSLIGQAMNFTFRPLLALSWIKELKNVRNTWAHEPETFDDATTIRALDTMALISEKLLSCYPIHPKLFDYLYDKWTSLENFQKTRGVLRLMARVISFGRELGRDC